MKKYVSLFLLLFMVFSLLVGCTVSTKSPSEETTVGQAEETKAAEEAEETKAAEEKELIPVRYAMPRGLELLDDCVYWSAIYMGFFEEEGIDFQIIPLEGTDNCKQLAAGQADIAGPAPNYVFTSVPLGIDVVNVYQVCQNNIFGFVVLDDSPIKEWKDFEGKSVVGWPAFHTLGNPIMFGAGVDYNTIEWVPAFDQRTQFLGAGTADAAFTWQMEWQLWEALIGKKLRYFDGDEVLKNCSNAWFVTREYYEDPNNKEIIAKCGRALAKGIYFSKINPEASAAITVAKFPTLGVTIEEALPAVKAAADIVYWPTSTGRFGEAELSRWEVTLKWTAEYSDEINEEDIDLSSILKTEEFVDDYNDWDKAEVEELAKNFDINSVKW